MADIEDLLNDNDQDTELVRTLRNAIRDLKKDNKQFADQLAERAKADRSRDLSELLKSKELDPKIAKLYPGDGDVTAEAVDTWLSEFGDVFGIQQAGTAADDATVQAAQRIAAVTAGAPPAHAAIDVNAMVAEIAAAKNQTELDALYVKFGMK
jgi:hypothetical protein